MARDQYTKEQTDALRRGAMHIIEILHTAGFEAYVVGGAVRDILMHRVPHDYDIVTAAKPDEVIAIVTKHGYTTPGVVGKSFGVVVVTTPDGYSYEVATFRSERYGADSHRPEEITYADTLEEDVMRRDFTVNGLAMDRYGNIIDYVEGRRDIKKQTLRTIGRAEERFQEDALRMFRACRFVGQLDMLPHREIIDGMAPNFDRVKGLSLERVRQELDRLMLTPAVAKGLDVLVQSRLAECSCRVNDNGHVTEVDILPELYHLVDLPQQPEFHAFDGWYHTLAAVAATRPDPIIRWGALLHDVGKGMPGVRGFHKGRITDRGHDMLGAKMARKLLLRLRYPADMAERVSWLVANHMRFHFFAQHEEADPWKWMRKEAVSGKFRRSADLREAVLQQTEVCCADVIACGHPHASTDGTKAMGACLADIAGRLPIHTRDLAYGPEVPKLLGPHTGEVLKTLLMQVRNGQTENTASALYHAAQRRLERLQQM